MNGYNLMKVLALSALADDNIKLAEYAFNMLKQEEREGRYRSQDHQVAMSLQLLSDPILSESYGIVLSPNDSTNEIYDKIYCMLYLRLVLNEPDSANKILEFYESDVTKLKQKIMMTLIRGTNDPKDFSVFTKSADVLLEQGLDLNYEIWTYDGQFHTPLSYANSLKYEKIPLYLKEHGAKN